MYNSIQKKLIISIVPVVLIVLTLSFHFSMVNSRKILEQEIAHTLQAKKDEQTKAIENRISKIRVTADNFALGAGSTYQYVNIDVFNRLIIDMLSKDAKINSSAVWFEPYTIDKQEKYVSTFVENLDGTLTTNDFYNTQEFDYLNNELYLRCKKLNSSFFTEAYHNKFSNTYTITYVTPIQNREGDFLGCATTSFGVDDLRTLVNEYSNDNINLYIIESSGVFIAHTDLAQVTARANIIDNNNDFSEYVETILNTDNGSFHIEKNGKLYYIYFETITNFNWKLIYEVPASQVNEPLTQLTFINIIICIITLSIIIGFILYVSNKFVSKPVKLLLGEFNNISNNNYQSDIPKELLKTDTEFRDIGKALFEMRSNLIEFQSALEIKNKLLILNQNNLKNSVDYVNTIINALPIMMFVFDRNGYCTELHGQTPFSNRPKEFYKGKYYTELMTSNAVKSEGIEEFLNIIKNIDYKDGVVHHQISTTINGNQEYFEHNLTLCGDDVIISLCRRITDTVNHIQDMKYINDFDELTGLYNSRYFIDMVKKHDANKKLPVSIIVCDVNGLKAINDKYGFDQGDQLLLDLTEALNKINIVDKTVARVAGDEFAVILPETTTSEAENIIDDINSKCLLGKVSKISFSIGYGVDTALSDNDSLLHLIKSVEELLYKQKVYTSSGKKDNSIGLINSIFHAKNKREHLHSNRVSELCLEMAKALGWSQLEQNKISTAGLLHDIGKMGISESLLNKPGKLTEEEYKEMCTHPEIGYKILQSFDNMKELSEYAYTHHEKWDGTGYPRQLKGTDIPIEGRILAIADTFDAMTSSRSYREGLPKEVAIAELVKCKNTQFDPELVDIFIEKVLLEKLEDYQN